MNQERKLYCYEVGTLDWGWHHLQSVEKTVLDLFNNEWDGEVLLAMKAYWMQAQQLAGAQGYGLWRQGHEEPAVFWVPTKDGGMVYGFIFKQDHAGDTFVVTPYEMPWLA